MGKSQADPETQRAAFYGPGNNPESRMRHNRGSWFAVAMFQKPPLAGIFKENVYAGVLLDQGDGGSTSLVGMCQFQ